MFNQEKKLYNLEQAQDEAGKIKKKATEIAGGKKVEKEHYEEAGKIIESTGKEKLSQAEQKQLDRILLTIEKHSGSFNYDQLTNIPDKFHPQIAEKLIEINKEWIVAKYLDNFQGLNQEIAGKLIEAGKGWAVAEHLNSFRGLDYQEIAERLIEVDGGWIVVKHLNNFQDLDQEIAEKLIEAGKGWAVAKHLNSFQGLDYQEIAEILIKVGEGEELASNLDEFQGLDHQEIAEKLIEDGKGWVVAEHLDKFQNLDQEIAERLIEAGNGQSVAKYLNSFQGLDYQEIAEILIKVGEGEELASNLDKFQCLDHQEIAEKLIEAGKGQAVAKHLDKFQGLDHREIAKRFIKTGDGWIVAEYLGKFQGLDHKEIAKKLIKTGEGEALIDHIDNFQDLDQEIAEKLIEAGKGQAVAWNLNKFQDLDYKEIAEKLIKTGYENSVDQNEDKFKGEYFDKCKKLGILPSEAYYLDGFEKLDNLENLGEVNYQKWFSVLKEKHSYWQDEENTSGPFLAGAEYFGYEKMFKYIGQENRHDILYNFRKITELAKQSSLKPEQFYGQILNQVKLDDAQYGEEYNSLKSHQLLNNIADTININEVGKILEKAKEYKEIDKLQNLVKEFSKKENIFAGWKNLKKYYELTQLLSKAELVEQLKELKKQGKEKLYNYVETLAFHPNIDMQKVMLFWQDPVKFLNIGEVHAPESHERKKPSNYIEISHLDLTAEDLRDGLVEGDLDKLEDWQPLEMEYKLPKKIDEIPKSPKSLRYYLVRGLGVSDKEIRQAVGIDVEEKLTRNGKLFSRLNKRFKAEGLDLIKYLKGEQSISEKLKQELEQFRSGEKPIPSTEFRAKINLKSDPDGVVAGNDTACCMPFGSGKNNIYTFNPICSLFTIQRKTGDEWRTIAQSVLTKDIDIKKNVANIVKQMEEDNIKLSELVPEDILTQSEQIITADNIEVAPNFKSRLNKDQILEFIYRDFFEEYIRRFGEKKQLDKRRMIIGRGYSDALTHLDKIENTFVPLAPVGYSDNLGEESLELRLTTRQPDLALDKEIFTKEKPPRKDLVKSKIKGIENLTFKDSLQVAYLEGKAYADNETLMEYLHNMENALIAKDINNTIKNRPNLSLKYVSEGKRIQGYILAYQGRYKDQDVIYIADLAADPKAKMAGGRLIKAFAEIYKKYYLDKNNFMPILAEAREKTSYAIITKQIDKISKELGVKFKMEELGKEKRGGETMHLVLIEAKEK